MNSSQLHPDSMPRPVVPQSTAILGWAGVLAIALLSFFVHVVHGQLQRGEQFRAQVRALSAPAAALQAVAAVPRASWHAMASIDRRSPQELR